ncbi:MAG: exodeoxyribonuclease VII small subunit [Verrucomicrobiales bacterium]|nr:exodeoxyribonuclease VII small subunit [Verrucomicrobiales bacterium]
MAKPARKPSESQPADDDLSYGEALGRLESIVEAMEAEDLPLETLLSRYEEGRKLVDLCQSRLAHAELRIQQLERTADGDLATKPVSLDDPADA